MNLDLDLDAIRARLDAASPGPWRATTSYPFLAVQPDDLSVISLNLAADPAGDAAFVAHARDDVPALLAEVDRLRDQLATASRRVRHIAEHGDPHTAHALALIADELAMTAHPSPVGDPTPASSPDTRRTLP